MTEGGGAIFNSFKVTYDLNNCDAKPIEKGDTIGWIEVIDFTSAIPAFCPAIETEQPTPSPVSGSMSYSASFSLAHISKTSKGKATKSVVSKSGKLIRERS